MDDTGDDKSVLIVNPWLVAMVAVFGVFLLLGVLTFTEGHDPVFGGLLIAVVVPMAAWQLGQHFVVLGSRGIWVPFHRVLPWRTIQDVHVDEVPAWVGSQFAVVVDQQRDGSRRRPPPGPEVVVLLGTARYGHPRSLDRIADAIRHRVDQERRRDGPAGSAAEPPSTPTA